ncbi:MAG: hypothetical protein ACPLSX_02255, partial [Arcobacter sp.]
FTTTSKIATASYTIHLKTLQGFHPSNYGLQTLHGTYPASICSENPLGSASLFSTFINSRRWNFLEFELRTGDKSYLSRTSGIKSGLDDRRRVTLH